SERPPRVARTRIGAARAESCRVRRFVSRDGMLRRGLRAPAALFDIRAMDSLARSRGRVARTSERSPRVARTRIGAARAESWSVRRFVSRDGMLRRGLRAPAALFNI